MLVLVNQSQHSLKSLTTTETRHETPVSKLAPETAGPQHTCRKVFVVYQESNNPGVKAMVEKTIGAETCPACIAQQKQIQALMEKK